MYQRPKTVTRLIKVMKDPDPRFVSWVNHGANQTPFKVVKRHAPVPAQQTFAEAKPERTEMPIARKTEPVVEEEASMIRSFTFPKSAFPTESNAKKWLTDDGWEGFTIVAKGNGFYAEGSGITDEMFTDLREVEMDGVTAKVGKPIDPAMSVEGTEPAKTEKRTVRNLKPIPTKKNDPAAVVNEQTKKWDWWVSYSADEFDLNGVVSAAMSDGIPPGMMQVMDAMTTATSNVLKADTLDSGSKQTALKTIGDQFGTLVYRMWEVFSAVSEETVKTAKAEAKKWYSETGAFFKSGKMNTNGDNEGQLAPKPPASGAGDSPGNEGSAVPSGEQTNDKVPTPIPHAGSIDDTTAGGKTGTDTAFVAAMATAVGAAVQTAMAPVTAQLTALSETVTGLQADMEVTKTATEAFVKRAPVKKGATSAGSEEMVEDKKTADAAKKEAEETAKFNRQMVRNTFGLPNIASKH